MRNNLGLLAVQSGVGVGVTVCESNQCRRTWLPEQGKPHTRVYLLLCKSEDVVRRPAERVQGGEGTFATAGALRIGGREQGTTIPPVLAAGSMVSNRLYYPNRRAPWRVLAVGVGVPRRDYPYQLKVLILTKRRLTSTAGLRARFPPPCIYSCV